MRNVSQKEIASPKSYAKESKFKITTKQITYIATLTAITLILKTLGNFMIIGGSMKVGFTYIGWVMSAIILGPFGGAVVGFCTDILGTLISATGAINPLLTLSYTLFPLIIGLFYKYIPIKNKRISLAVGFIVATVICTLGISSAGLYFYGIYQGGLPFWAYVLTVRTSQIPIAGINLVIVLLLYPFISKINPNENK